MATYDRTPPGGFRPEPSPSREPLPPLRGSALNREEDGRSLGELFKELTRETRTLMRQEIELARTEIREKMKQAVPEVGLMVAGGLLAYVGAFALVASLVLLVGLVMPYWLSALIVGLLVVGIGYGLAMKGMKGFKNTNFSLERTAETLEEDKEWLKHQVK